MGEGAAAASLPGSPSSFFVDPAQLIHDTAAPLQASAFFETDLSVVSLVTTPNHFLQNAAGIRL